MLERLKLPETRDRIRADIERDGLNNWGRIPSWDCVQISISPNLPQNAGQHHRRARQERGHDPIDLICDHLIEDNGATRVLVISISEDDIRAIVRSPQALVGSDGNCVADLRHRQPGHAASALLRHVPAHSRPLRARTRRHPDRAGDPQDDWPDRQGAAAEGSRAAQARLSRRHRVVRSGRLQGPGDLRRSAPLSDRRAHHGSGQWRGGDRECRLIPGRCPARCSVAIQRVQWAEQY